jgi:hypothetical protein
MPIISGTRTIAPVSGTLPATGQGGTAPTSSITVQNGNIVVQYGNLQVLDNNGNVISTIQNSNHNVGTINNPTGIDPVSIDQTLFSTSAERALASSYFTGGVGIEKDLAVGGFIYGRIAVANSATTSTAIHVIPNNNDQTFYPVFTDANGLQADGALLYGDNASSFSENGLTYNAFYGKLSTDRIGVYATDTSISTTTGALTVAGGVGIGGDINIGGGVYPATSGTNFIGSATETWATAYLDNIYSKFVGNTFGDLVLSPNSGTKFPDTGNGGVVDVFGDIRVRGSNPVGTAPVVTNVLYVTMDGDDTNDGRAEDASRACRTVSGAVKSPYFQSGTQIRVAPGRYLENNPIRLKPYTSVMGSDIRTSNLEPINKTQDLFHVDSGCYLQHMQFLNGRSGLLPGNNYINGTNRGAYCTAFPPLTGGDRIDLFHSPYIQNCTNVSGPWLIDGSMFVPNETVQVPIAVGTGTWNANTTSILVTINSLPINGFINAGSYGSNATVYTGSLTNTLNYKGNIATSASLTSIRKPTLYDSYTATDTGAIWVYTGARSLELGMSIYGGQQNPSFFNARTLMLANKPFLQAQVVSYLQQTYNSGNVFTYNTTTCYRDTGLIVDAIGMDMLHNSTSDSVFSGLQYWSQGSYTGNIVSESTATIAAINTLSYYIQQLNLNAGNKSTITRLISTITNILTNGVAGVTSRVQYGGLPSTTATILNDSATLQNNKSTLTNQVLAFIQSKYPLLAFNSSTCRRDVGYIIDALSFDLVNGGNAQSIKSGVYYYGYISTSSAISGEITQTIAAYNYVKNLVAYVVTGVPVQNPYQMGVTQKFSSTPATIDEVYTLQLKLDEISSIIVNGPDIAPAKVPQNLYTNTSTNIINAWSLLNSNRSFIQAEVLAYINATMKSGTFDFQPQKSYRDTGILVENIAYDVAFGGNEKSIESGRAYWNGPVSYIANSIPQCTAAINYLNELIQSIIVNSTATVLPPVPLIPQAAQVRNTALVGGAIASDTIDRCFDIVNDIIVLGPDFAPQVYKSTGPDAAYVSAEILLQANRKFIQEQTINYINYNLVQPQTNTYLPYNKVKCRRDLSLIIDSVIADLRYPSVNYSQSTFAGLQYWSQGSTNIAGEVTTTTNAVRYLKTLASKVIKNTTATDDLILGVTRYTTGTQITNIQPGTAKEIVTLNNEFNIIIDILSGNITGWSDRIIANGDKSNQLEVQNAYALLQANKNYMQQEVLAYIKSPTGLNFTSFTDATCIRDLGYIIDGVSFDLLHGGNRQAVQSGLSYYNQDGLKTVIPSETTATSVAFNYLGGLTVALLTNPATVTIRQNKINPDTTLPVPATVPTVAITAAIDIIRNIIINGPTGFTYSPISLTESASIDVLKSYNFILANKKFLIAEVLEFLDQTYNPTSFKYDQDVCYRDIGLMVDAVSQDILLGGNQKSSEAGLAYWNQGYNYIADEITTTTAAISYISAISKQIIANTTVTSITGTISTQVINPFFKYGDDYMPQQAVERNFGIISTIIQKGTYAAPPIYAGSGLFALTGINGLDVKIAPTVTYIGTTTNPNTYLIGLSTPTIGFGINSVIYFGDTLVFPLQNNEVTDLSLVQTGNPDTWNSRRVDPIGGIGGSLVDGAVVSDRSPIQSFVYDAYTQLSQGGRGVRITNNGYAQLVSVFTIFSSVGVQVDNGGIASIVNSNANFGDICLLAKGFGKRAFSGTVYNPKNRAYPFSPGDDGLDQYYPEGYWPDKNANIEVFVPDVTNRPHISLVAEVVAPTGYQNAFNSQALADDGLVLYGFLNAQPSVGTLVAGSVDLVDIPTTNIYVGNTVYILDQFGSPYDKFPYLHDEFGNYLTADGVTLASTSSQYVDNPFYGIWYASTGTTVADVNYNTITLDRPLTSGANYPNNQNYFTLYFCGNSYYTVQTSQIANSPYLLGTNILSANLDPNYQGPAVNQISAHASAMKYLTSLTNKIISNTAIVPSIGNYSKQYINPSLAGGAGAQPFVNLEFGYLTSILTATNLNAALSVVPSSAVVKTGSIPSGAGSAITLIENNINFLSDEIVAYVDNNFASVFTDDRCMRDTGLILDAIAEDVLYYNVNDGSGNYSDMTFSGLQYWSQQYTTTFATSSLVVESSATIAAIQYLSTSTVANYISTDNKKAVKKLFNIINNILANGPTDITDKIVYGSPFLSTPSLIADAISLQNNKATIQSNVVDFVYNNYPSLFGTKNSNTATRCSTDVGLMIDAVTFDLLTSGNVQSYKSGVYYYDYSSKYSVIPNETTATINAFNYLATVAKNLIAGTTFTPLQTKVKPVVSQTLPNDSGAIASIIDTGFSTLTNIISNGPISIVDRFRLRPQNVTTNSNYSSDNLVSWQILHSNRSFIQAEVIAYLDSLVFNSPKCYRDTGLIVDAIAVDLITNGYSDSNFAGLQYWSQSGYTGDILNEITTTTAAISYLRDQLVNYLDGEPEITVTKLMNTILDILKNGTAKVTDKIVPAGLASSTSTIVNAFNIIRANTSTLQTQVIGWINSTYPSFVGKYDEGICRRDVGYILDSVSFDLLHGGNLQSIKSGVYYYNFNANNTVIPNEKAPTLAAYTYLGTLVNSVIAGTTASNVYQTAVPQITNLAKPSNVSTVTTYLQAGLTLMKNIIDTGPSVAQTKVPVNVSYSPTTDQLRGWALLKANRSFLQSEVLAFITATYPVVYNPNAMTDSQAGKCARDVGLTLQQLIYDLGTGGNYNMIYAGLSYWSRPNTYHIVELGEAAKDPALFPDGAIVNFYQRSYISASGYVFEYVGAGTNYGALPQFGKADPIQGRETIQLNSGKVFFTSTDQNGDFRIGPGLVISQATGVISGRTFTQSLFANMTPFILAIT